MANSAIDLQQQVQHNAEDFQNYLKNLYQWEEEIKAKDENEKKPAKNSLPDNEFPIRNKPSAGVTDENGLQEVSTKKLEKNLSNHANKQQALIEKNQGNEYFKGGHFEKAIKSYSMAIELDPMNAILPANRAISFLKLNRFAEAEEDCNKSLVLDPTFVKAYHRRGVARFSLKKLDLAIKDFEKVLSMEPHNKAAQVELEKLRNQREPQKKEIRVDRSLLSTNKPLDLKKKEKKPSFLQNSSISIEEYFEPAKNVGESLATNVEPIPIPITLVKDEKEERLAVEKIINEITAKKVSEIIPHPEEVKLTIDQLPGIPRNYFKFNQDWKKFKNHSDLQYRYLKQIPPVKLPDIFQESLETDVLADIFRVMKHEFVMHGDSLVPWLLSLSRIKRIGAVTMFLAKDQKNDLQVLLKQVEEMKEGTAEERESIFLMFSC